MDGGCRHRHGGGECGGACGTLPVMRPTDTERGTGAMSIAIWMFSAGVLVRLHGLKNGAQHWVSRNDCRAVPRGRSSRRYLVAGGEEERGVRVCVCARGWVGTALLPIYPACARGYIYKLRCGVSRLVLWSPVRIVPAGSVRPGNR